MQIRHMFVSSYLCENQSMVEKVENCKYVLREKAELIVIRLAPKGLMVHKIIHKYAHVRANAEEDKDGEAKNIKHKIELMLQGSTQANTYQHFIENIIYLSQNAEGFKMAKI